MSVDDRGVRSATTLRQRVADELDPETMLSSLERTRRRRRAARSLPAVAALVLAVAIAGNLGDRHGSSPADSLPATVVPSTLPTTAPASWWTDSPARPPGLRSCPACAYVSWAPDGRTFATTKAPGDLLAVVDAATRNVTPVTLDGIEGLRSVTWSPQSDRLAFVVTAPVDAQGVYVVGLDGRPPTRIVRAPTTFSSPTLDPMVFDVSWSPAAESDRLAITTGTPTTDKSPKETGLMELGVRTMNPDGSAASELLSTESCYCLNFWPSLVWSPDGRSLAVDTMQARPDEDHPDQGVPVRVRFVKWGGALSWFPG